MGGDAALDEILTRPRDGFNDHFPATRVGIGAEGDTRDLRLDHFLNDDG